VSTDEIYAKLTEIFGDVLDDEDIVLRPDTVAADIAEWDSLNHVVIIAAAESKFGIKFNTVEIESLRNVGEMVDVIQRKLSAAS
jgi:acyl carrier protein